MVKFKEYPLGWHSDDMAWLEFSNLQNLFTINVAKLWIRVSESSISGREDNKGEKSKASKLFYYSISDQYLSYFTKDQKLKLISLVEKDYFKNKKFSLFLKIFKWHILNTDLLNLIKFFRRIYINS
jgi:hypothetical protein